jgi:hypothetical protein
MVEASTTTVKLPVSEIQFMAVITDAKQTQDFPINHTVHVLSDEDAVNQALKTIREGVVGFDTEFMTRIPTEEEAIILKAAAQTGQGKKAVLLGWQVIEILKSINFPIAWSKIGLCVIQIARGSDAWVIDLTRMKGKLHTQC